MKAMFKENEKNRLKETKNKLMNSLAEVEKKIDDVEKEIKQKTLKKETLEAEEKKRAARAENQVDEARVRKNYTFYSYFFRKLKNSPNFLELLAKFRKFSEKTTVKNYSFFKLWLSSAWGRRAMGRGQYNGLSWTEYGPPPADRGYGGTGWHNRRANPICPVACCGCSSSSTHAAKTAGGNHRAGRLGKTFCLKSYRIRHKRLLFMECSQIEIVSLYPAGQSFKKLWFPAGYEFCAMKFRSAMELRT